MAVTQATLNRIKAAPISSVIEATGAALKRIGREYLTQCIWHEDKNPSLTVSDDKGFCYCHVCRKGGDSVDYVGQRMGLGWRDALQKTADILSITVELVDEDPAAAARRRAELDSARAALEADHKIFRSNLKNPKAGRIRQILKDRKLTPEASKEFELGYSSQGFFSGRVTIPIHDNHGKLVGFTGRATKSDQPGKYKNSADSLLFNKKMLVFNEHRAKEAARETESLVFVEGHLDVVSMWQAGIKNVVAAQGTGAPDSLVLQRLSRNIKTFILCFDGDAGGVKATELFISAAGQMALEGKININVVTLPEGSDPDDMVRRGEDLRSLIANAPCWLDWLIDTWATSLSLDDPAAITDVEGKLKSLINGLSSKALRTHYIDKASRVLSGSDKEAAKLAKEWVSSAPVVRTKGWAPLTQWEARLRAERRLVRLFVHRPGLRQRLLPMMRQVQSPPIKWLWERLKELRQVCDSDLTPHSAMAVVCVAEPHFMQQLRTIVQPTVHIDDSEGVLTNLEDIMGRVVSFPADETDTDQPLEGRDCGPVPGDGIVPGDSEQALF